MDEPSKEDIKQVFTIACTTLNSLSRDPEFFDEYKKLRQLRNEHGKDFDAITEVHHFVGSFYQIERKVLRHVGLADQIIDDLLSLH